MAALIAISVFFLSLSAMTLMMMGIFDQRLKTLKRLEAIDHQAKAHQGPEKSLFQHIMQRLGRLFNRITPQYKLKAIQNLLDKSGFNQRYNPLEWLTLLYGTSLMVLAGSYGLIYVLSGSHGRSFLIGLMLVGCYRYGMHFMMLKAISGRKRSILRELPYALDLITVSVEAGLSFDGAITKYIQTRNNALSNEFEKLLKEVKIGLQRRMALRNMINRVQLDELATLLTALIQADELGVGISKVLRVQAEFIRDNRKMRAREKALKAPVKMLFPLIFFIFPSVFVIILGPAVIRIFEIFL